jgi:superoxide oxidase
MTLYSPVQPPDRLRGSDGRRRFDSITIGLHCATVALIAGMFASAWLLIAGDGEHAAMLLIVHRSLGVTTWAVAIVRLCWRLGFAYLPPFPPTMPKLQRRSFTLFAWQVPSVTTGNKPLTTLFHEIHELSAWLLLGLIGLHILAALFHRFILRDEVLQSMLPWRLRTARQSSSFQEGQAKGQVQRL